MKPKITILYAPDSDKKHILKKWLTQNKKYEYASINFASLAFYAKWGIIAIRRRIGIFIDYPIDSKTDLDTVTDFLGHIEANPGNWYYAPRPNDYLPVERCALMGMKPAVFPKTKKAILARMRSLFFKLNKLTSIRLQILTYDLANKIYLFLLGKNTVATEKTEFSEATPTITTPISLTLWDVSWKIWNPSNEVKQKDLLDRVDKFFPHPKSMHIALLNRCNLQCTMCPYHSLRYTSHHTADYFKSTKIMSEKTFQKIADYAGKNSISLQFGQIEEPLLHKKIIDFFKISKKMGVPHIHLTTNGTLLTKQKADQLAMSGVDSVMFSLDAVKPETYSKIRGKSLEQVEENIQYFMNISKKIVVSVSFIMQEQSKEEKEQFLGKWQEMGVDSVTYYVLAEHDPYTGQVIRHEELYNTGKRYVCASPWVQAVVFPEGEVSLCCKTLSDVGWKGVIFVESLNNKSFEKIWVGESYRKVRHELIRNEFEEYKVCKDCRIWSATSYIEEHTNDYSKRYNETMETIIFG